MKVTNKFNLPDSFVNLVKGSQFKPTEKHYSVTTILNPVRSVILNRRHFDEIEIDASNCVNQILGTAVHGLIEKFDKTGFAEVFLKQEIQDGYYLTGKCDLYDEKNSALVDWKTATVWKIKFNDFEDWKKQGLMYAWLLIKQGKFVDKLRFYAILKDWTARELRLANLKGDFYPNNQVYLWEYKITTTDLIDIENFIRTQFAALIKAEKEADDELPDCGEKDTWFTGNKYAVYKKKGDARAMRVLETEKEAQDYMQVKGGTYIEKRIGEYRKCQDYCDCCKFCKYYNERKAK